MTYTDLEEAAYEYLTAELDIIALTGKMPNTDIHPHGLREPLSGIPEDDDDWALICSVFGHSKTTGVGIVLPDHLVVVDIDGEEGAAALADILSTRDIPQTRAASTGRGLHLYYATTKVYRTMKLGEKLDLKGVGGYVAAPPSVHPSGAVYKWLDGDAQYEWLPDAIVQTIARQEDMRNEFRKEFILHPSKMLTLQTVPWSFVDTPLQFLVAGLVRFTKQMADGERNNGLNWAAYKARENGVSLTDALSSLGSAAAEAGLPEREIRATIRSAYRSHG